MDIKRCISGKRFHLFISKLTLRYYITVAAPLNKYTKLNLILHNYFQTLVMTVKITFKLH